MINVTVVQVLKLTNEFAAQVRDLSGKVTLLEEEKEKNAADMQKLMRAVSDKTTALEDKEKVLEEKEERIAQLEAELALVRSREVDQGAFAELVVEKVLRTTSFGEVAVKMSTAAIDIGKQEVLNALMAECPQLKLRKRRFGWDPYATARANKLQQEVLKGDHEFVFLTEVRKQIEAQGAPLTLEQLKNMTADYDADLDATVEEIPETYPCEDEEIPLLLLEGSSSANPPTVATNPELETEQAGS